MNVCKQMLIAAGAESVPRTCPVHGPFGCGSTSKRPGTSKEIEELAVKIMGMKDLRQVEIALTKFARKGKRDMLVSFASWMSRRIAEFHACTTGDCPHWQQSECSKSLVDEYHLEPNK